MPLSQSLFLMIDCAAAAAFHFTSLELCVSECDVPLATTRLLLLLLLLL